MSTRPNAGWCRCGHAERGLVRIGLQPGDELLDENTELEPRELADGNEILAAAGQKAAS